MAISALSNFFQFLISLYNKAFPLVCYIVSVAVTNFFHLIGLLNKAFPLEHMTNYFGQVFPIAVSTVTNVFQYLIELLTRASTLENLTNVVSFVFSVVSTLSNFFQYLIGLLIKAIPLEHMTNYFGQVFSIAVSTVTNFFQYLIDLLTKAFALENLTNFVIVVVSIVSNLFLYLIGLFNQIIISQETWDDQEDEDNEFIPRLIDHATPYLLPAVLFVMFICLTKLGIKMMKAPGRPSTRISRARFEQNPARYFRTLRAAK